MQIRLIKWKKEFFRDFYYSSHFEELYCNMNDSFPRTLEACEALVASFAASDDKKEYIRAIEIDGVLAGCIAAYFEQDMYCKNAELAYWISKSYWGMGITTETISAFTSTVFSLYDIHRIYARPFAENKASGRVLEKCGFTLEGILKDNVYKNGAYQDTALYGMINTPYPGHL